ncbi:hypothetical protein HMPREF3204_00845 [Gardnerella pickettii]|nr:hypothetical protein HMPREF3204_00845 [Gardnerella pickettii]
MVAALLKIEIIKIDAVLKINLKPAIWRSHGVTKLYHKLLIVCNIAF